MFTEKITFPDGILVGNKLFIEAVLEEEVFSHALQASSLPDIDFARLDNPAYYSAALIAARLAIPGLFEERMEKDADFRAMVEEFAEKTDRQVKEVTPSHVCPVTVEMIETLSRADGRKIMAASNILTNRRADFRTQALTAADGRIVPAENGLPGGGDQDKEPGGDPGNT